MATATAPESSTLPSDGYRGAVVEESPSNESSYSYFLTFDSSQDLQLAPAFSISANEAISRAVELAYERDFSHIPVLNRKRQPLGYVDVAKLKGKWEAGQANPDDKVSQYMIKFNRTSSEPYTIITPLSPLSELENFLKTNIFALVTDQNRKFVLAVATAHDLENFVRRRGYYDR